MSNLPDVPPEVVTGYVNQMHGKVFAVFVQRVPDKGLADITTQDLIKLLFSVAKQTAASDPSRKVRNMAALRWIFFFVCSLLILSSVTIFCADQLQIPFLVQSIAAFVLFVSITLLIPTGWVCLQVDAIKYNSWLALVAEFVVVLGSFWFVLHKLGTYTDLHAYVLLVPFLIALVMTAVTFLVFDLIVDLIYIEEEVSEYVQWHLIDLLRLCKKLYPQDYFEEIICVIKNERVSLRKLMLSKHVEKFLGFTAY